MCGIVGFKGHKKVIYELLMGLTALQHRGQDAAGIVTFKNKFHTKKGLGLVNNIFKPKHLKRLDGKIGVGHVRYTTHGSNEAVNAQPISASYPFGITMVHNGNVTNLDQMQETLYKEYHTLPETSNDLELILYTFASELKKKDLANVQVEDIFESVIHTQKKVKGAYSVIAAIANHGLLAFCDPHGIRPLIFGKRTVNEKTTYGFASESTCFDHIGFERICDMKPGEIIFIDNDFKIHKSRGHESKANFCVFEYIYFARDDSIIHNKLVANQRVKMGKLLAGKVNTLGLKPDVVIDVPSSGYFAASGLAEALDIPYRRGLMKNNHIGRSFISPSQKEREDIIKRKLNPIREVVDGKKVAIVDDSIVRGTTSKRIVKMIRDAGAKEIYFISAAPPIAHPCMYGIDMSVSTELIAAQKSNSEICSYIGADALIYQSIDDLKVLFKDQATCMACLDGKYPTKKAKKALKSIEKERIKNKV